MPQNHKNKTSNIDNFFKAKKVLLAAWSCENKFFATFSKWDKVLIKIFGKIIVFDPQMYYYKEGRKETNKKFIKLIKNEKPDYIILNLINNVFNIDALFRIKEVLPKIKIIIWYGDDDTEFENRSRYTSLISDYNLIVQKDYIGSYKKDGIKNSFFIAGSNPYSFKPFNLEKLYDVTFIGVPKEDRYNFIKHLLNNKVNIRLFGYGWEKFPELKNTYGGVLTNKEIVKVINQTKINLCFVKNSFGNPHIKGRIFEIGLCKSFLLTEFYKTLNSIFKKDKEIVMFKDKEDLLDKINYYLKNEEEREKIASAMYSKILSKYTLEKEFDTLFNKVFKERNKNYSLPFINRNIALITKKDINDIKKLREKIKDADYICFRDGIVNFYKSKNYLQAYSLQKLGKPISCCDYQAYSKKLGYYLEFSYLKINAMPGEDINPDILNINQLMVTKEFFIKNMKKFKEIFYHQSKIDFLNKENTSFISIPLFRTEDFKLKDYGIIKKYFNFIYLDNFRPLIYKRSLLTNPYIYNFIFQSIFKNKLFLLRGIFENLLNKDKLTSTKILFNRKI